MPVKLRKAREADRREAAQEEKRGAEGAASLPAAPKVGPRDERTNAQRFAALEATLSVAGRVREADEDADEEEADGSW